MTRLTKVSFSVGDVKNQ